MALHALKLALAFAGIALFSAATGVLAAPHPASWVGGGLAGAAIIASVVQLIRGRRDGPGPE